MFLALAGGFSPTLGTESPSGEELYATLCASCHGPLASTNKPNRSYGRLLSSIRTVPSMYHLKRLKRDELDAILKVTNQPERAVTSVKRRPSPQI